MFQQHLHNIQDAKERNIKEIIIWNYFHQKDEIIFTVSLQILFHIQTVSHHKGIFNVKFDPIL